MKKTICLILCILTLCSTSACSSENKNKFYGDSKAKTEVGPDATGKADDITKNYSLEIPRYDEYFTLGKYKGIEYYIDDLAYTVNEEAIDKVIISNLDLSPIEITDRPAEEGDYVTVTFKGTIDGETFEGCSAENVEIRIGDHKLMTKFEDKLVGLEKGKTDNIEYTFPDDYSDKTIAGKTANFTVTLNSIKNYSLDIITDDIVKEKTKCETLSDYKKSITDEIQSNLDRQKKIDSAAIILAQVLENSEVKGYDDKQVTDMIESAKFMTKKYAESAGVTEEEYVKSEYNYESYDAYVSSLEGSAHDYLDSVMVITSIAHAENITVTDEEYLNQVNEYMLQYNVSSEDISKYYTSKDIIYSILVTKVYDWAIDNSVKLDKPIESKPADTKEE